MQCKVDQVITETQRKGENCRGIEGRVNVSQVVAARQDLKNIIKHSSVSGSADNSSSNSSNVEEGIRFLSRLSD
jgi:hypothetical protein